MRRHAGKGFFFFVGGGGGFLFALCAHLAEEV